MSLGIIILAFVATLGAVNFAAYFYIYSTEYYSKRVKRIFLIAGNIIMLVIWLYFVLFANENSYRSP